MYDYALLEIILIFNPKTHLKKQQLLKYCLTNICHNNGDN